MSSFILWLSFLLSFSRGARECFLKSKYLCYSVIEEKSSKKGKVQLLNDGKLPIDSVTGGVSFTGHGALP